MLGFLSYASFHFSYLTEAFSAFLCEVGWSVLVMVLYVCVMCNVQSSLVGHRNVWLWFTWWTRSPHTRRCLDSSPRHRIRGSSSVCLSVCLSDSNCLSVSTLLFW